MHFREFNILLSKFVFYWAEFNVSAANLLFQAGNPLILSRYKVKTLYLQENVPIITGFKPIIKVFSLDYSIFGAD